MKVEFSRLKDDIWEKHFKSMDEKTPYVRTFKKIKLLSEQINTIHEQNNVKSKFW